MKPACSISLAFCFALTSTLAASETRLSPNIIVIVADDMGYSDLGCYGGEIKTPSLDRLAGEGIRLARFYNGGMCVISRASLMTGQWWPQAVQKFEQTPLLSEQLGKAGYRTALIGKWHLPGNPMDCGFDHFFGFLNGFADHFAGSNFYRLDREPFSEFGPDYYSSDAFTDRAIEFIRSTTTADNPKPFMLYLSYQAPHNPLQVPQSDIPKYRGKYLAGWQAVRKARFMRQKELGIFPHDAQLPDQPQNLPDWDSLTPEQQDLEDLRMAVYAAMVERMDEGIGRVMQTIEDQGLSENTLVLFLSDNGTDSFSVVDRAMLQNRRLPGDRGSNWQPGTGWAYASVTPWRLYKISQHAGGVTTGAILRWPAIGYSAGDISHAPVHIADVMPTLLDAVKPTDAGAMTGSLAGESFLPLLRGESWQRREPLFFQFVDNRAIRTERWTAAAVDGGDWELFDNQSDLFENHDRSDHDRETVDELSARWLSWWIEQSGKADYQPESTKDSIHYRPQGDRGTGVVYQPSAMPAELSKRHPKPSNESPKP